MNELQMMQERSVLRWGGLAGIAGGILFIAVFVIVGVFVGADPAEPEGFPGIRAARTIENSLYLAVLVRVYTANGVRAGDRFDSTEPINVVQRGEETP